MSQLNELNNNGFSKINRVLSKNEIEKLRHECLKILDCAETVQYPNIPKSLILNPLVETYQNDKSRVNFINQKFRNCVGVSQEIDNLLTIFFKNPKVNTILKNYLTRPKLQFCTIRYADENSNWLGIHSDSGNTISMSILLNDTYDKDPTTAFINGSHLYSQPIKNKIERLNPSIFSGLLSYSTGIAGDVTVFFNRVAHGVLRVKKKNSKISNIAILMCFHSDENFQHRNLMLPKTTLYGQRTKLLHEDLLKFFELEENERETRNKNINLKSNLDKEISSFRVLKNKEFLTYYYLKLFEYFIKVIRLIKRVKV